MKLKKELGFWDIFCIASGSMISSGLFVLPAIVYLKVGPSIIIAYIFASLLMIPAMFSKTELATAMPKSGGTYFFIHRSLGAFFGTFAGLASWFSLSLKSAFALLGIGLFLQPLFPETSVEMVKIIAVSFAIFFAILNIIGAKESGRFQIVLVIGLISILTFYFFSNINHINAQNYIPFNSYGWKSIFTATGMIFISFGGLTKIVTLSEEIKNPKKNIPKGMFVAFVIVTLIYILTIFVTVGLLGKIDFQQTFNPISLAASKHYGNFGYLILSVAAMLAFITTGNAGLLSSSRIPLAMSKDNLLPSVLSKVNLKLKTPIISILMTSVFMVSVILFLELENLVKVASTMMLILFLFVNFSVILMRESKIITYRPSFKSPFYPYLQIIGIIVYLILIIEMGNIPLLITLGFLILSILWYFLYSKKRNSKQSALIHIVERISAKKLKTSTLTDELKDILIKRDDIIEDKFDRLIKQAKFIDVDKKMNKNQIFEIISNAFSKKMNINPKTIYNLLEERENVSSTVIYKGLAIPHIIIEGEKIFDIIVIRSQKGIDFGNDIPPVHILFALVGSIDERSFHLQALMSIAQIIQNKNFIDNWEKAKDIEDLKNLILLTDRIRKDKI
ncbi:MAG: amino acid permease [Candidatus Marinimicrobia bacterium]|nr:amino acid permease [Candidatus Neomarinimicrobiota bacterium]